MKVLTHHKILTAHTLSCIDSKTQEKNKHLIEFNHTTSRIEGTFLSVCLKQFLFMTRLSHIISASTPRELTFLLLFLFFSRMKKCSLKKRLFWMRATNEITQKNVFYFLFRWSIMVVEMEINRNISITNS